MTANRREFLRQGLVAVGAAAAGGAAAKALDSCDAANAPKTAALTVEGKLVQVAQSSAAPRCPGPADPAVRRGIPGRQWVMVIDLAQCDGCGKCIEACGKMHYVPSDRQWIKVLRMQDAQYTAAYFFPQPCYHCDNPPCAKVCPVGATFKREDGVVLIDNTRCVGCRFCLAACPYGARSFNWSRLQDPPEARATAYSPEYGYPRRVGTAEKCDFCTHCAREGMLPACVSGCAKAALYYGDQNEDAVTNSKGETVRFAKLLRGNAGYRHLEELGTQPRVYYLPPKNRVFPAPGEKPEKAEG